MPCQIGKNGRFPYYEFYVTQTKDELDTKILNSNYSSKGDINYASILSTLVIFPYPETGRYISLRSFDHGLYGSCAEFNLHKDSFNFEWPSSPILSTQIIINESNDECWHATANSE